jgi:hypothetical protein
MAGKYRVLIGCNYPNPSGDGEIRHEPGDLVEDLPEKTAKIFLRDGVIEPASAKPKKATDLTGGDG